MYGTLWIVATPLGNLGDFSPRARQTLETADLILAEDTRRAGHLLQLAGVAGKSLLSLHEHNEISRIGEVMALLEQGQQVAVVSDAGTPLIADPGFRLVAACRRQGVPVVPVPGPCAPIAALMASGLPPYPFVFWDFFPARAEIAVPCSGRTPESVRRSFFLNARTAYCQPWSLLLRCSVRGNFAWPGN